MELELEREYFPEGTNGTIYGDGSYVCHTIELPWKNNEVKASCIPEGRYELLERYSTKFGWHILLRGVPGRDLILMHPANNALKELRGCIAPVSQITGEGEGVYSGPANGRLKTLVFEVLERKEKVFLTIKSKSNDTISKSESSNTQII
ncbi:MAG: hypothetical protein HYU69_13945 [Bacteroidetes bacterium]|nr:hypothetical protein [Bacteroidota bacterium]